MTHRQLKIAYILPSLANKGPVLVVKDLVACLKDYAAIDVFYFDPIVEVAFNCPVKQIRFSQAINFEAYDIVHSHMLHPDAYLRLHHKQVAGKSVSTLHNYVEEDLAYQYNRLVSMLFSRVWRYLLSRHALVIALSRHMQAYYKKLYGFSNMRYVYNGRNVTETKVPAINLEDMEKLKAFKAGYTLIGAVALLTHRKGIDQLIRLLKLEQLYRLVVVGDGPAKQALLALATKLQVTDRCLFLGYRLEASAFFPIFDVYAMPSRSEGFPLALIEAAAHGVSTICSDLPVFREILPAEAAVFFELENIQDLQAKTRQLLATPQAYGAAMRQAYQQQYRAETMAQNYLEAYQTLLKP